MRLLREWVRFLLEGYMDDQKKLIEMYPEYQADIRQMKPKMIDWFIKNFGDKDNISETHPFNDCISTVKKYDAKAGGINKKYLTNVDFKKLVDSEFPQKKWSTPADYINLSVDDMETILRFSERGKARFDIEGTEPNRSDYIGKFGTWNLWMPTTQENSVKIAGYDPETLDPKTTWCTARITGSNLFYSYAGRGIILFYLIKDNPKNDNDWLSIGFSQWSEEPELTGTKGGISVNRANEGLTLESLMSILGPQMYFTILNVMKRKVSEVGGEHPAKKKVDEAAKDITSYKKLIKGLSKKEAIDFNGTLAYNHNISDDVAYAILNAGDDDEDSVINGLVRNSSVGPNVLHSIAEQYNNYSSDIIALLCENTNISPETLDYLVDSDVEEYVIQIIAENDNTSAKTIEKIVKFHFTEEVLKKIAKNTNTPGNILTNLSKYPNYEVKRQVAKNYSTPAETLDTLAYPNSDYNHDVADNPSTLLATLKRIVSYKFEKDYVRSTALSRLKAREKYEKDVV